MKGCNKVSPKPFLGWTSPAPSHFLCIYCIIKHSADPKEIRVFEPLLSNPNSRLEKKFIKGFIIIIIF